MLCIDIVRLYRCKKFILKVLNLKKFIQTIKNYQILNDYLIDMKNFNKALPNKPSCRGIHT